MGTLGATLGGGQKRRGWVDYDHNKGQLFSSIISKVYDCVRESCWCEEGQVISNLPSKSLQKVIFYHKRRFIF